MTLSGVINPAPTLACCHLLFCPYMDPSRIVPRKHPCHHGNNRHNDEGNHERRDARNAKDQQAANESTY
jgi:hypothetical protein